MLAARVAAHHCDADRATICDTELMSKHSRSDGQLPLLELQQLLYLSSLLTLVPPHVRDEHGLIPNVARPTRVWAGKWKKKQVGEVVQRSEGGGAPRATEAPKE